MKCTDEKIGSLITLYEFDQLSRKDRIKFEAHLLECEYCLQSLEAMAPVVNIMRNQKQEFLSVLPHEFKRKSYKNFFTFIKDLIGKIFSVLTTKQFLVPAVSVAVVVLIAVFIVNRQHSSDLAQYSKLAQINPVPYVPLRTMGTDDKNGAKEYFIHGMQHYSGANYLQAAVSLDSAAQRDPQNMEIQFYLGLSRLLADDIENAISCFLIVIENYENPFLVKAYWYLGKAYLKNADPGKASEQFKKVCELGGSYQTEAKAIIAQLKKIIHNN